MGRLAIGLLGILCCLALAACDWDNAENCEDDSDCVYPEQCIDKHCIDDSCTTACPSGEYCSSSFCYPCRDSSHCGPACINCSLQVNDTNCIWDEAYVDMRCGCWGDYDCGAGCCFAGTCGTCGGG